MARKSIKRKKKKKERGLENLGWVYCEIVRRVDGRSGHRKRKEAEVVSFKKTLRRFSPSPI
jgi:hypothetical protein